LTGLLTVMLVAVTSVGDAPPLEDVAGSVRTSTQLPTVTAEPVARTVRLNLVVAVQVTATWPLCGDWTCSVRPLRAAI
jgi:hypothetical protein